MHAVTAHISAYSLTGDMARYSLARECLAGIRALAGGDSAPASAGPELRSGHLPLWEGMRKLDRLIEEYRSLAEDAAARRSRLRAGMRDLPAPAAALAEQALAAGLARDRAALENAEKAFAGQAPQAKESRESIEALRRNLEAGLALDQDRAAVFDALSATVRDAALRAAADMAASARNADGALHGAMMTLAAAVVLGCALAAGAAVLLLRAAREKRKAP